MGGIKTVTNLYDRFGYERSSMETRYGTETVPIRSTVMITGNEYPADDPLMQRLILEDSDRNKFTDEEVNAFRELNKLNAAGITCVLAEILTYRNGVVKHWREVYEKEYDAFREQAKDFEVPSRMIENYSVLLATYRCMEQLGLFWPFAYEAFKTHCINCLRNQAEKRSTGAVVQKFWDIVLSLASKGIIHEGKEFLIDGPHLYVRFKEVHTLYMEEHLRMYRQPGLLANTLQQKLKISAAWVEYVNSKRFKGGVPTSAFKFDYGKLNIDLIYVVNQKRSFANTELIETDEEKEARLKDEQEAKDLRAREAVRRQADNYKQEEVPFPDDEPEFIKNKYFGK
jgi:DNA primase